MKTKFIIVAALFMCTIIQNGFSQDSTSSKSVNEAGKSKHAIGLVLGTSAGYGLSYRYTPNRFGAQVTFAPYIEDNYYNICTGLTFTYDLKNYKYTRLFLYQSNSLFSTSTESFVNNGVGAGIELISKHQIGTNLMAGYASYDNLSSINLTAEIGLFYKF